MRQILVVDPLPPRGRIVLELLATVGWTIEVVQTPWDALAALNRAPYQLVIVNGGAHSSAGLALGYLMRTRGAWQQMPVLQLGGRDGDDERREARRAGLNLCVGDATGFEDLLLRVALIMGNDPTSGSVIEASSEAAFDAALAEVWQAQIDLLHCPQLAPGSLHAAREVLERLLSLRRDEAAIDAALALTGIPKGGVALRRWADRHLPCPPRALDPAFERLMGRCVGPLMPA